MANHPFCYDLAYKKSGETAFVTWAQSFKSKAVGGLGMLVEQAAESFYIWHGVKPETSSVLSYLGLK
jgi:shikimate dehydrogenase